MAKHRKDPLLAALAAGEAYTWTVPDGGNLASMRAAIKHGQTLTMSPIADPAEIRAGDMVLVKWHQTLIFHVVGEIQGDQYLIVNSLGKVNGWVSAKEILGRVTQVVESEPRPSVAEMLDQLEAVYQALAAHHQAVERETKLLSSIIEDLRWYAARIGAERQDQMPRSNRWSFAQNLWRLLKQARAGAAPTQNDLLYFIDSGKQCVGAAAEIYALFEYAAPERGERDEESE